MPNQTSAFPRVFACSAFPLPSRLLTVAWVIVLSLPHLSGCGGDPEAPTPARVCIPGEVRACPCTSHGMASTGTQLCLGGTELTACGSCVCVPLPCPPEPSCGVDGCGHSCGTCPAGTACDYREGYVGPKRCIDLDLCSTRSCDTLAETWCCRSATGVCSGDTCGES